MISRIAQYIRRFVTVAIHALANQIAKTRLWYLGFTMQILQVPRSIGVWFHKYAGIWFALIASIAFILIVDDKAISDLPKSELHLAVTATIATAFALVLSLAIVPAQKAVDAFSSLILELYKQDRLFRGVFTFLSFLAVSSLFLATGVDFWGVSDRHLVGGQILVLGIALDLVRAFYRRSLDLLVPDYALGLTRNFCAQIIVRNTRYAERAAEVLSATESNRPAAERAAKWYLNRMSSTTPILVEWLNHLQEFAHKAISRKDLRAAQSALQTIRLIACDYVDARKDSLVLVPDLSVPFAPSQSDVNEFLNPSYEAIKRICDHAIRDHEEGVATACIKELGEMTKHFMAIEVSEGGVKKVPLVFGPIYYLGECQKSLANTKMLDALLTAVHATRGVFENISDDVDSTLEETSVINNLFQSATISYGGLSSVPAHQAIEMMVLAIRQEIQVRGVRTGSLLDPTLRKIGVLLPAEIMLQKSGLASTQTLAPYTLGHVANLANIIEDLTKRIEVDPERSWVDPFNELDEGCQALVRHYREAGKALNSGGLLRYWVIVSCFDCAERLVMLLESPPPGSEPYLETVETRLSWFVHVHSFYFDEAEAFENSQFVNEVTQRIACLGISLLRLGRFKPAIECVDALSTLAQRSEDSQKSEFITADIVTGIETIALAADALGQADLVAEVRSRQELDVKDDARTLKLVNARINRFGHLQRRLEDLSRGYRRHDPVQLVRNLRERATADVKVTDDEQPISDEHLRHVENLLSAASSPLNLRELSQRTGIPKRNLRPMLLKLGAISVRELGVEKWMIS